MQAIRGAKKAVFNSFLLLPENTLKALKNRHFCFFSFNVHSVQELNNSLKVKIIVTVPIENTQEIREAICKEGDGIIGNYFYCTTSTK